MRVKDLSWRGIGARGAALLVLGLLLWQAALWARSSALEDLGADSRQTLGLTVSHLRGVLEKYEALSRVFAADDRLVEFLVSPDDPAGAETVNRFLERLAGIVAASDVYLMDPSGLTLAASNWQSERPFVGRNFAFRPYFQDALMGELGRYYALGTTSRKRGYYFAYPVRRLRAIPGADPAAILGVIVVKVDIEAIEAEWAQSGKEVVVTDPNGVIFLSTKAAWKYRLLRDLDPAALRALTESRQFGDAELRPFPVVEEAPLGQVPRDASMRLLTVNTGRDGAGEPETFLTQGEAMPEAGWTLHILAETSAVGWRVAIVLVATVVGFAMLAFATAYAAQRRITVRERLASHARVQGLLEERVRERTRALQEINLRLTREIGERKAAEAELRATQDDLVQAGKLAALGQMSAGISHELNQPLAAIRSFADNAGVLLSRGRETEAKVNLTRISELIDRMARIIRNLRAFARKDSGEARPVSLGEILADSLALLETRIAKEGVELIQDFPAGDLQVMGGPVRLQQVLVNLIGNALDAMAESPRRELRVALILQADAVAVAIRDSGPGIAAEILPNLFDPFFTTKEVNRGLGLGLSLSYGIVQSFGGTLTAANHPDGGAVFTLRLRRAAAKAA